MSDAFAVIVVIEGVARIVAVTFSAELCEVLRALVAERFGVPAGCRLLGRAV